jgi:hypothetical protein
MLRSPCVYTATAADGTALYIGASANGYTRIFNQAVSSGRADALRECDQLAVEFYDDTEEAFEREEILIHERHPKYNKQCVLCDNYSKRETRNSASDEIMRKNVAIAQALIVEFGHIPDYNVLKKRGLRSFYYYTKSRPDIFR